MDHLDGERAAAGQSFGGSRSRAQKVCQFCLCMPELIDGISERVDGIERLVDRDRPSLCLVDVDKRQEHIELVALLRALWCAPTRLDRGERIAVVLVRANRPD